MVAWLSRVIPLLEAKAGFARIALGYATDSVLLWDEAEQRYDEETTPGYGSQTLQGVYTRVLREGVVGKGSEVRRSSDEERTGVWSGSF